MSEFKPGLYRHFKGNIYAAPCTVINTKALDKTEAWLTAFASWEGDFAYCVCHKNGELCCNIPNQAEGAVYVLYVDVQNNKNWLRPVEEFTEEVRRPRFQLLGGSNG